jgi:hypothetical protein
MNYNVKITKQNFDTLRKKTDKYNLLLGPTTIKNYLI